MLASATFRERLPSAAAAVALQVGLFALLALSFEAVRHVREEHETILTLPPLARPAPVNKPMVIDARRKAPPPVTPAPSAPIPGAMPAAPAQTGAAQQPAPAQADCVPEGQARPAYRIACPPPAPQAHENADGLPLHPEGHVKNAEIWQSEIERRNTPPRVPCITLTSGAAGIDGYVKEEHGARLDITCAIKTLREGASLLPPVAGAPLPDPGPSHASDADFKKALAANQARLRILYPQKAAGAPQ